METKNNSSSTLHIGSILSEPTTQRRWWIILAGILASLALGLLCPTTAWADGPVPIDPQPGWFSGDLNTAWGIAWGDMDGDGDLDLAVGNPGVYSSTCTCYLGEENRVYLNQDGALESSASWVSGDSEPTTSIAWGDVDGDGDLDLAVGNYGSPNQVFLNQGGTLEATPVWTDTVDDYTTSVAWGDVDGDGGLDLAVGNGGWGVAVPNKVYPNQGGALNTTPWTDNLYLNTWSVAWGDVDGDGDLDLAIGNRGDPNYVYLNKRRTLT